LKRVRASDERSFIGGKFLIPTAIRYDGQCKASNETVRPCTFLNFPYISLERHDLQACNDCKSSSSDGHPKRTLLQSRYRLEKTISRDSSQSVTTLSLEEIKKCVTASTKDNILNPSYPTKPILHVPQMWFASLSGGWWHDQRRRLLLISTDVMITNGPLTEKQLRSSVVKIQNTATSRPNSRLGPALVRIILDQSGKDQKFTYPVDQCDWWFVSGGVA
jgi:hypothetical protein